MTTSRQKFEIHTRLSEEDYNALKGYINADGLGELATFSDVVRAAVKCFLDYHGKIGRDQIQKEADLLHAIDKLQLETMQFQSQLALANTKIDELTGMNKQLWQTIHFANERADKFEDSSKRGWDYVDELKTENERLYIQLQMPQPKTVVQSSSSDDKENEEEFFEV